MEKVANQARRGPGRRVRIDRRRAIAEQRRNPQRRRAALFAVGIALLVVVGVAVGAFVMRFVLPSTHLIVAVDGVEFDRADMIRELRIKQQSADLVGRQFPISEEIFKTFNELVENQVIRLEAPGLGIIVTEEEIDAEVDRLLGPTGRDAPADERQQIEREFRERYKGFLNILHINEADHREFVKTYLLREKVRQFVGDKVPTVAEQAHVYRISVLPEGEIEIMKLKYEEAVNAHGTSPEGLQAAFKGIAREFAVDDPETIRVGGDLGWVPEGVHKEYDQVIFNLDIGELSEPIPRFDDPNSIYFFMVSERSEAREIDLLSRERLKTNALQDWLNDRKAEHELFADLNSEIHDWIVEELRTTSNVTPTPRPGPFGF